MVKKYYKVTANNNQQFIHIAFLTAKERITLRIYNFNPSINLYLPVINYL